MVKFTSNNDFDFGMESVALLKDFGNNELVKRASHRDLFKGKYEKTPGQEDLHIIALGAYEGTGQNRNGDCFLEKDCEKNYKCFQEAGRAVHRHHKNKPSDPKYGNIKAAAYNKKMRRIELVIGLDRDKCADILDEQEKTGNSNWSMAAKLGSDLCSWCGHRAKTDNDRCEHIPANLGEINKEGEMCSMINSPDPRWFEISYVKRPADRIGMSLSKLASAVTYKPMSTSDYLNLYGDIYIPDDLILSKKASDKRELLQKLSDIEKHVDAISQSAPTSNKDKFIKEHGHKIKYTENIDDVSMDTLRKMEPSAVLKTLAENKIFFSPEDFATYLFNGRVGKEHIEGMKTHLPHIFSNLEKDDSGKATNDERYEPSCMSSIPSELKALMSKLTEGHSLSEGPAVRRIMMISITGDMKPHKEEISKEAGDLELARQYGIYKLAALNYLNDEGKLDDELMLNVVLQDQ